MSSTITTSGISIATPTMTGATSLSPSLSPVPSNARRNSADLRAKVESERAEVLSDVKEAHHDQFEKVDSLSQQLESTAVNSMDMFKRDLPTSVAQPNLGEDTADSADGPQLSSRIVITSPTSSLADGRSALAGATLVKTVRLDDSAGDDVVSSSSSYTGSFTTVSSASAAPAVAFASIAPIVTVPEISSPQMQSGSTVTFASGSSLTSSSPAAAKPTVMKTVSPTAQTIDDRESGGYVRGVEKDTAITSASPLAAATTPTLSVFSTASSANISSADQQLQILSLSQSLIQAQQACSELMEKLYGSNIGSSLIGADMRPVTSPSPSALLPTVNSDDRSLSSFLQSLPVLKGWLTMRQRATANLPPSFVRKYASLSFDGLMISEDESGAGGVRKVELSRYWLIERTKDKMGSDANYAAPASASASAASASAAAFDSPLSPVAGKSVFRLEDGAYVLRLVPILTDSAHPQTVLEPSASQILEFTGASEDEIARPDTLSRWVDALNLRISLLSVMATPDHTQLLARGGREVVSFLCSLDSRTLVLENKLVDAAALLAYFKEPLIHRRDFSIALRNVALDDEGARVLSELLMLNPSIHYLDLSSNAITGAGASYLATSLEVNQTLSALRLDFNTQLTDDGMLEIVSALAASPALTSLSLRGCKVTDRLLRSMLDSLRGGVTKIWTLLDLSWNQLTDESAETVAELLSAFSVAALNLSHNGYGDKLVSAIDSSLSSSSSSSLSTLALLDVSHNSLSSASATSVSSLLASCQALSIKLSGNSISPSTLIALLSSPTALTVEELRITRLSSSSGSSSERPAPLEKRLSIVKENTAGRVELIDPLHPRSTKDLGRELEEVSADSKDNSLTDGDGPTVAGEQKDVLDVPPTAAATELLVDGGKTADPRHVSPSSATRHLSPSAAAPTVDTRATDPRSLEMEAEAAAEAARARVYARAGQTQSSSDSASSSRPALSKAGLVPMTPQQMATEQQDSAVKGKYPQADLSAV